MFIGSRCRATRAPRPTSRKSMADKRDSKPAFANHDDFTHANRETREFAGDDSELSYSSLLHHLRGKSIASNKEKRCDCRDIESIPFRIRELRQARRRISLSLSARHDHPPTLFRKSNTHSNTRKQNPRSHSLDRDEESTAAFHTLTSSRPLGRRRPPSHRQDQTAGRPSLPWRTYASPSASNG